MHVLDHGDHNDAGGAFVVGSDEKRAPETQVENLRLQVASDPDPPTTLFR